LGQSDQAIFTIAIVIAIAIAIAIATTREPTNSLFKTMH
jgi:hypothetical protein